MDRLYGQFVRDGDLVFDVGSHVGDRVGAFRRLGETRSEPTATLRSLRLTYYNDDHADLDDKLRPLQNERLLRDITSSNGYIVSERLAASLGAP
jgi:hypothetical protein